MKILDLEAKNVGREEKILFNYSPISSNWCMFDYRTGKGHRRPPRSLVMNGVRWVRFTLLWQVNPGLGWVWYRRESKISRLLVED